jgi:hypothetical protein
MWIVETLSDDMKWSFDTITDALKFYDDVRKYGEQATFPKFKGMKHI